LPIQYDFDEEAGILVLSLDGHLTRDDFRGFFSSSAQDPRFRPQMPRLVITTGALSFPPSTEVPPVARMMRERTNDGTAKFAIVASSPLSVGMANMFMGLAGMSDSYELFSCPVAARNWLTSQT
jgi:hypothetical protein